MRRVLGKTTESFANMVALGAKKDGLIAHDANYAGGFSNAVVTMYLTAV